MAARRLPLILGWACAVLAGCGGAPARNPTRQDIAAVGAAVFDVVFQCQSVAAGYVSGPDSRSLDRDVNTLVALRRHVRLDASFVMGSNAAGQRTTTLRKEIALAVNGLNDAGCAPAQARRLARAAS